MFAANMQSRKSLRNTPIHVNHTSLGGGRAGRMSAYETSLSYGYTIIMAVHGRFCHAPGVEVAGICEKMPKTRPETSVLHLISILPRKAQRQHGNVIRLWRLTGVPLEIGDAPPHDFLHTLPGGRSQI